MTDKPATIGSECPPNERGLQALERLQEELGVPVLPSGFRALSGSENGISDVTMNLSRQLNDGELSRRTKLLAAVAISSASGSQPAVDYFARIARSNDITPAEILEAISVATTLTAFNAYFRFRDQLSDEDKEAFREYRAPFAVNTLLKRALPEVEVEAICIAVSSYNGCRECTQKHTAKGKKAGLTNAQIDELAKAAAVVSAAAAVASSLDKQV